MPKVTFLNEQLTVEAKAGQTVLEVAEANGINVFRGLFQELHCGGDKKSGWCNRCKLWATPLADGAVSDRSSAEKRRMRIGGAVPLHGTMRLACQVQVQGDVEVRTRTGFPHPRNLDWQPDPRHFKWQDRWAHRNDEPDEDEKPKAKAAATGAKAAASPPKPASVVEPAKPAEAAAKAEPAGEG